MPALTISPADQATVIRNTAAKYNIPLQSLLGIYGQETNFGQNVTASSTGAIGPFQFEPATARQYGYPLTNTPTLAQFTQQADAWGRFLVANNPSKSATGWAPAMGGGYTEKQAESTLAHIPSALKDAVGQAVVSASGVLSPGAPGQTNTGPAGAISSAASAAGDVGTAVGNIASLVTSTSFWLRIGEGILGILMLYLGLHALTGQSSSAGEQATHIKHVFVPV